MQSAPSADLVLAYVAAINAHDVDAIVGLSTPDHRFVDAHGDAVAGDRLRLAWQGYFAFMPCYGIAVEQVLCDGDDVAIFGYASGSLAADHADARSWRRPCAWRARIARDRIALWQVYVDTKAVFDLL